ncbi:MAG TPA: SWIM zinc finger family protein [Clostridiales bacterium]|nr:SWIM zinc finger family protein [Clostridiales bacterium]
MKKDISSFLDSVPDRIFERGEDYYANGNVTRLVKQSDLAYVADVAGSNGANYRVELLLSPNGKVDLCSCDCPYDDDVCKHIVAVLLAVENGDIGKDKTRKKANAKVNLRSLLEAASREQLYDIILAVAEKNKEFEARLIFLLGGTDPRVDLDHVKELVRLAIRNNTKNGYIDYSGCDNVCDVLSDCLDFGVDRYNQGRTVTAFDATLFILLKAVELASTADSSSGSLTMVIDDSYRQIDSICFGIARHGADEEKKYCYEKICKEAQNKVFRGWTNWDYDLLRSATHFATAQNAALIYAALNKLREWSKERHVSEHCRTADMLTLWRIKAAVEGEEAAFQFVESHLDNDTFRQIAVRKSIENGDFAKAETLCLEKTEEKKKDCYYRPALWWTLLYEIYEKSGNRRKQIEAADNLLFQGDLSYFDKLKQLYQENGEWQLAYPLLRARMQTGLPYDKYMMLLDDEGEDELLFTELQKHPDMIFVFGNKLARHHPKEVYDIYWNEIVKESAEATDRRKYRYICRLIRELYDAGGKAEALQLIHFLRQSFNKRPAMLDELGKLLKKLKK